MSLMRIVLSWGGRICVGLPLGAFSQNHRIVGFGRDLCGSSSPTLLPKQGHLQQAAQHLVQAGLEYLQRRRLHNLPKEALLREALQWVRLHAMKKQKQTNKTQTPPPWQRSRPGGTGL